MNCRGNKLVCFKIDADVGGYDELEKGRMNLLEASNCVLSHVMDGKSLQSDHICPCHSSIRTTLKHSR